MIREVVDVKSTKLREKSKPVRVIDKKIRDLIQDLKDTLVSQNDPEGVGLAAPQIGKNQRVFAIKPGSTIGIFINPEVVSISKDMTSSNDDKKIMEGCLSMPHYYGPIQRARSITIKYQNEEGEKLTETFKGFKAHIIQHEIDHLNGVLFIDKLLEQKKPLFEFKDDDWFKVDFDY